VIDAAGLLHLKFTYHYSKTAAGRRLYFERDGDTIPVDTSILNAIKSDIDYVYIPASRSSKDFAWGDNSIFERLVTKYLEEYTRKRDNLSQKANKAGEDILKQSLHGLAKDLSALNMVADTGDYNIGFKETIDYRIFLDKLGLEIINQASEAFPVTEYGSGIKSLTVIALHRMLANLNNVSIILGIEEPEINLHPQAQKMMINSLKNSRQSCETQAIFATHSTVIIDALDHDDIVLVRKVKDERRGFRSQSKQLADTFWEDHQIEDMKHYNFFRYKNSDFFFARFVILVESPVDAQVIERIINDHNTNKLYYVSIVNLDGVNSLKYPFFLLKDLGIPFCAVVDKDFFTPYKNGKLEKSRNAETCLPEYSGEIKRSNAVIKAVFNTEDKIRELQQNLKQSYSKLFDYTKQYGLLPMQYCLEMDLVACDKGKQEYADHFGLNREDPEINHKLLIDKKDAIKASTLVVSIVEKLQPKDYPFSYKKIRAVLMNRIDCI